MKPVICKRILMVTFAFTLVSPLILAWQIDTDEMRDSPVAHQFIHGTLD
jgi:hypothetical protein